MPNRLNEQIAALRRERGLTQEQLGQMVGVSAQAVSKWEKGGAPDVELLPVLAGRLGVTIDELFGLEGGERVDVRDAVNRWLQTIPAEQRMDQFCRLVFSSIGALANDVKLPEVVYPETCYMDPDANRIMYTQVRKEGGMMLNTHAEDFSFVTLWPEPKKGYAAYFAAKSEYRSLFELLARPGCLELLEFFYTRDRKYFVAEDIAKQLELPLETVEPLLKSLREYSLLWNIVLELGDKEVSAYTIAQHTAAVPFFCIARSLMQEGMNFIHLWSDHHPILRSGTWKNEEEPKNEKE